jgi:hypothetical protein
MGRFVHNRRCSSIARRVDGRGGECQGQHALLTVQRRKDEIHTEFDYYGERLRADHGYVVLERR